jgi:hypothetical protein
MYDTNWFSIDAFTTSSLLAWSKSERLAVAQHQHPLFASTVWPRIPPSSSTSTIDQQSVFCAASIRLS